MHAIGPIVHLGNDGDMRPIQLLSDWHVNEHSRLVHHRPSKLAFLIDYAPPPEGEYVKPSALSARLVHACNGTDLPPPETLRRLAKDAIHAFLLIADVCHPPTDPDQIPF